MRVRAVVFVGLLLLASIGCGVVLSDPAGAQSTEDTTIDLTQRLHRTPDRPGEIAVTQSFDLPEDVTRLRTQLPEDATIVETNGFRHDTGQEYVWTGDGQTPSLRYLVPANVTSETTGPIAGRGAYLFVDVGEWALVRRPLTSVNWAWRGDGEITISRSLETAGPGAAGEEMAFLGEHQVVTHAAAEQTFRLVVPAAADLGAPTADIFDSLAHASRTLRVGERDPEVFMVAAPTGRIDWAVRGIQTGSSDLWVRDEETLDTSDNVWVHEYVHTRQDYATTAAVDWVTEASATYYAALLAHESGGIDYGAFRNRLALGTREPQASAILADPGTWHNNAQYHKGALVVGSLDRELRLATDRGASYQHILAAMNAHGQPITHEAFLSMVESAGDAAVRTVADRFTTTSEAPDTWSESEHVSAFSTAPARIAYRLNQASYRVAGPYRNSSLASLTVVPGERLGLVATVSNTGGTTGPYEAVLRIDGTAVDRRSGDVEPETATVVEFTHTFEATGTHTVAVGGDQATVQVLPPADARVTELAVDRRTVDPGDTVRVTATVLNPASIPGDTEVAFRLDGQEITTRTVRLGPSTSRAVTVPVELLTAGTHRITAANGTVTVRVGSTPSPTASEASGGPGQTTTDGPPLSGFGFGLGVVAVGLLALVARSCRP